MNKYTVILLFCFLSFISSLWANPFTADKNTPAPVRTEKTPELIAHQQAKIHNQLGEYIYEWSKTHSVQAFWTIMWLAFFYGFMHALGPGHRKTLVFSFYLSKPAPIWEPLLTSIVLAALHGITSIVLLLIFRNVTGAMSGHTASVAIYLEGFSFIVLLILSAASILHSLSHIFPDKLRYFHFGCGCSVHGNHTHTCIDKHHTTARHCSKKKIQKIQWHMFILSGMYPCPAALLVLVLISTLEATGLGILTVTSMSLGMAVPITAVAYLAWTGRVHLFHRMQKTQKYIQVVTAVLGITAYGIIFLFSLFYAYPFIKGLLK